MCITREEIEEILSKVEGGDKVLEYIDDLEEQIEDLEYQLDEDVNKPEEIETEYKNELTVKDWEELLKDKELFDRDALIILKRMRHVCAPVSIEELSQMFGYAPMYYQDRMITLAEKLCKKLGHSELKRDIINRTVLFNGWRRNDVRDTIIHALRPELYEALGNIDLSDIPLREEEK